jgi:cell wall-active antibiotic response 4TMS protein YvqF/B-box zinc finger protein
MNCATHHSVVAVAYCRTCGKPLCATCVRDVRGTMFCEHCLAERVGTALPPNLPAPPPGSAPPAGERLPSPGMAAVLGFIPGVGAMYNGQFMKGFVHVMAFVCLIWMADHFGPIMIPVFFAYFFYLVFDAYKTAHALELGQPVPDPFGFERMFGPTPHPRVAAADTNSGVPVPTAAAPGEPANCRSSVPTGAVVLIVLGLIFLLHTVGLFEFGIDRFWPVILIGFGGWMFARRWGLLGEKAGTCFCDRCKMRAIMGPSIMVTVGVLFLLDNLHGPGFQRTWPLILLVIGAVKLLQSNASEMGHVGGPPALPPSPPPGAVPMQESVEPTPPSGEVNHV